MNSRRLRLAPAFVLGFACVLVLLGAGPMVDAPTTRPHLVRTTRPLNVPAASTQAVEKSVRYLASDELEGRGVGTKGLDLAAQYIAEHFQTVGLERPGSMKDYFQEHSLSRTAGIGEKTSLQYSERTYRRGEDYTPISMSAEKPFDGPVVFVGYGISSKEQKYDDYTGVDVKGKIVLAMRLEPRDKQGRSRFSKTGWSQSAEISTKARTAVKAGAAGLILVNPPGWQGADTLMPLATLMRESPSIIPVLHVKRSLADEWLKAGGAHDLKTLTAAIDEKASPQSVELKGVTLKGQVAIERKDFPIRNVAGILRGKGPRAEEYIVIGAHYDHLGHGEYGSRAPDSKAIHNGADDNASGTAAMMETARMLAAARDSLDRSVLFVAFTAEELGLVGSRHFVNHPPVPLSSMVAMINLDMVGRLRDRQLSVGGLGVSTPFESAVNESARGLPVSLKSAFRSGYAPSDNTSFMLKKIPALFFFTGLHQDYHRPSDDADKINFAGVATVADLTARVAMRLSHEPRIDFIAPSATAPATMRGEERTGGASLGIIPDYGSDTPVVGVPIAGVMPGTPAEKAGLKEGDILVQLGDSRLSSLEDLSDVLGNAQPGVKTTLVYTRAGKTITVDVVLAERRRRE